MKQLLVKIVSRVGDTYVKKRLEHEALHQKFGGLNERAVEYRFVFSQIAALAPKRVLDVGTGVTALPAVIRACGCLVDAIDNVRDYWPSGMVNRHFHVADEDIRKPSSRSGYDLVTCVSVLEHIVEHRAAVKAMFSLLRPGGHLIITCPYTEHAYHPNVYKHPESTAAGEFGFVTQSYSRTELASWLADSGGILVEQEYWQFFLGEFWTVGGALFPPIASGPGGRHQMTCLLLRKPA